MFAVTLFFSKLVSYTFMDWLPFYIKNTAIGGVYYDTSHAAFLATLFDAGGIGGSCKPNVHLFILSGLPNILYHAQAPSPPASCSTARTPRHLSA